MASYCVPVKWQTLKLKQLTKQAILESQNLESGEKDIEQIIRGSENVERKGRDLTVGKKKLV